MVKKNTKKQENKTNNKLTKRNKYKKISKKNIKKNSNVSIKNTVLDKVKIKKVSSSENEKNFINKINYEFKHPPNLKFKSNIAKYLLDEFTFYKKINVFEVFTSHKDNMEYLALPNKNKLNIIQLIDNKKIKTLKGHHNNIMIVEYYINHKNYNNEYLISIEGDNIVIIWDINNNYNIIHKFGESWDHTLVTCLLYFPYNFNEDYIITPMHDCDEKGTKVYLFPSNHSSYLH